MKTRRTVCVVWLLLVACRRSEEPSRALPEAAAPTADSPVPSAAPPPTADVPPTAPSASPVTEEAQAPSPEAPAAGNTRCEPQRDCCAKDADCVALDAPQPCACPPCGEVLRWSLNRQGAAAHEARWSRRRCRQPECQNCTGSYVGTARCVAGRCAVVR